MKYATKDKDGNITYTEVSDRKKCLTYNEFKKFIDETDFGKHIINRGTDSKFLGTNNNNYFWALFNNYSTYPMDIAKLHEWFGRGVEVETYFMDKNISEVYIRAYKSWK